MDALYLNPTLLERMLQLCTDAAPYETSGLVGGWENTGQSLHPVLNVLKSQFRYRMEPQGQLEAMLAIESQGESILAIYHSHPLGPDHPSSTDLAEWTYPEALCIICSPESEVWSARCFQMTRSAAHPVEIRLARGA
jgi:proteasome lid subunit RPN8/RPN11